MSDFKTNFLVTIIFDEDSDIVKQTNTEFSLKNKIVKELQHLINCKEIKHFIVADDEVINHKLKEESKKGHWIPCRAKYDNVVPVYECSICHENNGFNANKYCPNCGAKMEESEEI